MVGSEPRAEVDAEAHTAMKIPIFEMERWQSVYENTVEFNLSESGVHPATLNEIGFDADVLASTPLFYSPSNGSERFRTVASSLYPGALPSNILATIGGAEANLLAMWHLVEPGDDVLIVLPNYMQIYGLAQIFGGRIIPVWARMENQWIPDPQEIADKITPRTKLISVCNPNNPTGSTWSNEVVEAIGQVAERNGSWILADEVYQGAEIDGVRTRSFWGTASRVLVTHSMSKAYGTPGLRLGWLLGPSTTIQTLWSYADYTKIAPPTYSDMISCHILEHKDRILERTRGLLHKNWPNLTAWLSARRGLLEYVPPRAGAFCMVRYHLPINSSVLAERLRVEKSTLIVPGDQFLMDGFIRFGYGSEPEYTKAGLDRVGEMLESLAKD